MPDFIDYRYDEDKIGMIVRAKLRSLDTLDITQKINPNAKISRTIERPIEFKSVTDWMNYIREEWRTIETKKKDNARNEMQMNANLAHFANHLNDRFNRVN